MEPRAFTAFKRDALIIETALETKTWSRELIRRRLTNSPTLQKFFALGFAFFLDPEAAISGDLTDLSESRELIVRDGDDVVLGARSYKFDSITIRSGGVLRVSAGQSQWLIFDVVGDVTIEGRLEYKNMRPTTGAITAIAPDGTKLSYTHPQTAVGGDGGVGGWGPGSGGAGANGTASYGGGGGGGATSTRVPPAGPGKPAVEHRGGDFYVLGGNGGLRRNSGNGGLIYIRAGGEFLGSGGVIDVSGSVGENGKEGGHSGCGNYSCSSAPGGGGGGAPGGDGGVVCIFAATLGFPDPKIYTHGEAGGSGGPGGLYRSDRPRRAGSGTVGQSGDPGFVDFNNPNSSICNAPK